MVLRGLLSKVFGNANERELQDVQPLVDEINALEGAYQAKSDEELRQMTDAFLARLADGETLDDILVEAFAAVREASKRTTGMRPYDVQLMGGVALHNGRVVEMRTGEGKTLVATLPLYLNALLKRGAHLVTVNDYLARRDVQWMGPIYHLLGLRVGLLQQGQDQSFVFDPANDRGGDDYRMLRSVPRRQAYAADITYGTNSEFGFDYLRDNSARAMRDQVQRDFYYAIVDEVDNILIDEARTPLIISGPSSEPTDEYYALARVVRALTPEDFEIDERTRAITLTDAGYDHVEQLLGAQLFDPEHPEEMTPQQAKLVHHLEQALKAQYVMQRNRDYILQGRRVVIVDEFTGRTMPGRRWSDGLHQAVEAKEGVEIQQENITYATITLQNYFRMYEKLSGMTGTAATEAEEFDRIYELQVLILPTNRPIARDDAADVVLRTEEGKLRAIVQDIVTTHCAGRPILVGTTSVEMSERLSERLDGRLLRRWSTALLIREKLVSRDVNTATYREGMRVLNRPLTEISASELRKLGREVDIGGRPTDTENVEALARILGVEDTDRLERVLARGLAHNVLNARHHTEEARIVARAGESGAVTIATNMAGRGVDIKLGGEIDEETLAQVSRVLNQNGIPPFGLSFTEMAQALRTLDPARYYLYKDGVERFLQHVDDEERVKVLGGLHVVGTERHEARRIDNQLRGRAGRQGDPGSSRFYLSLEDDLMRRFGGNRVTQLVERLGAEDDIPIALGIVSRAIANAQTQVEGHNFDIRKHLLEYDDVLNTQREVIYEQRRRILSKRDLRDDVWEIVQAEVERHVDAAWSDESPDPVRLVAYMEQVQPTAQLAEGQLFPSFALAQILEGLPVGGAVEEMRGALRKVAREAIESERRHALDSLGRAISRALETEEQSIDRFLEAASIAYEGIEGELAESGRDLDSRSATTAVAQNTGLDLDESALHGLAGRELEGALMEQVRDRARAQMRTRLLSQVQARAGVEWVVDDSLLSETREQLVLDTVMQALDAVTEDRVESLIEDVEGDIATQVRRATDCRWQRVLRVLNDLRYGTRTGYDDRHQRVSQRTQRFQYTVLAADRIAGWDRDQVLEAILEHLQSALDAWERAWGQQELQRIGSRTWSELDEETQRALERLLGKEQAQALQDKRIADLADDQAETMRAALGRRVLFNVQRQLMLDITTRYWVEHLTAMEVLRQGIGLQSYAQRDPLAEYKVRAYEMFQELLLAIQSDLVTAMFTYRPRDLSQVRVGVERKRSAATPSKSSGSKSSGSKRRRKRRRKR
jgi:preprotein translocase subunit SecA